MPTRRGGDPRLDGAWARRRPDRCHTDQPARLDARGARTVLLRFFSALTSTRGDRFVAYRRSLGRIDTRCLRR
jgi:hypothetical protein